MVSFTLAFARPVSFAGPPAHRERRSRIMSRISRQQRMLDEQVSGHDRGVLSMARSDEPHSASTHFFILVSVAPDLDGKFSAFGRVTKGIEVVDAINKAPVVAERPDKPVRIRKAVVFDCVPQ